MQPQDTFGISRRAMDVEDYIDILRRHKGWILGPAFLALVASVVGVYLWPDTYVSSAVIKVVPQQVPENFVQSNVNQLMTDRISSMAESILSRGVLTTVIQTYGLYPHDRNQPMEDLVEKMRRSISVGSVQSVTNMSGRAISAFQITFSYENRYLAMKVVSDLVSRFIDQNLRERNSVSVQTTQFLKDEMDAARRRLDVLDGQLAQFRMKNQGHLPDEMQANLQQLGALQARMTSLNEAESRISQEKLLLETQIRVYRDQLNSIQNPKEGQDSDAPKSEKVAELDRQIAGLENSLTILRERYKESHPDVQHTEALLKLAHTKRDAALKEEAMAPKPAPGSRPVNPAIVREIRQLEANITQIESQVQAKNMESEVYQKELKELNNAMKTAQSRIESTPIGDKQYQELIRDRDLANQDYQELAKTMERSDLATQMEGRKQGETLELLDPASLPTSPTQPKRGVIITIGTGLGLLLGVMLAGAREMKDTALKNLKDVRAYTQLSILGSIPLLENDLVVRRRRRIAWLSWATAGLVGVAVMSGSVVYYYATRV
ncbi:MAG TPA: Wzz/FepE/Etk N-terminal domain-containing protein [Bryobacteraceae bacterium]|nr:Wzz/FepE/Etk N-terminal domain-containing protein [Bryobacteraceae bacterium]